MEFRKKVLLEALVRYIVTFFIVALLFPSISLGLHKAAETGKLEAIAVIMGIVSLCSLTGYFSFSYTVVAKSFWSRFWGYVCAFGLTLPLILCWLVLYFVASISIPEMSHVWLIILLTLYIGILVFDLIDLMRMGLDIAATSFFEQGVTGTKGESDKLESILEFLTEGKRLAYANGLIGTAISELGQLISDRKLTATGEWIQGSPENQQHVVDRKIVEAFEHFSTDSRIKDILVELNQGQTQVVADSLIVELIRYVKNKYKGDDITND